MAEESPGRPEIRFCPYCFQQQFQVSQGQAGNVYCEICGIDVEVKELVKE